MALARAMKILRAVASAGPAGARAGELSSGTGIHRVTVHRLLAELTSEGLVEQDGKRSYHFGAEAWSLGHAASHRFDLARIAEPSIERIEQETHDTVYLLRRTPGAVLCIARRDGRYPVKSLVMDVGVRYPLGIGGAGLAILAFLSQPEIDVALKEVQTTLRRYPRVTMARVRALLLQAQKAGYAYWPGLISEAHVVGVSIRDTRGEPVGALSCAAIKERLCGARRKRIVGLLKSEAEAIGRQIHAVGRKRTGS